MASRIKQGTKKAAVLQDLSPRSTRNVILVGMAIDHGEYRNIHTLDSTVRRILSELKRAGLAERNKRGWLRTAKGDRVAANLA